jgi:hypothetical protein
MKKNIIILSGIIVLVLISALVIFLNITKKSDDNALPDFSKPVKIQAKYAEMAVSVRLNPDKTCIYTLNSQSMEYTGKWEISGKSENIDIMLDVSPNGDSANKKIKHLMTIYGKKSSKGMAGIPVQYGYGQFMTVYGNWEQ